MAEGENLTYDVIETDGRSHCRDRRVVPPDVREALRELRDRFISGEKVDVFENREGILPPTGPDSYYIKQGVGCDRGGSAGKRRVVIQVTTGSSPRVLNEYWTPNHYGANNDRHQVTFYHVKR